ncbi:hypothetical protein Tco_1357605 [Tanacetum coccineum]
MTRIRFAAQEPVALTGTPSSTTIDQDATSTSTSQTTQESQSQVIPPGVEEEYHDIKVAYMEYDLYFGLLIPEPNIFTKPLGRERLEFLMKKIGMQSMSPETLKRMVDEIEEYWCAQHNVITNEQQHTDQSVPSYDTYLLEKVDINITPDSTNMSHMGG